MLLYIKYARSIKYVCIKASPGPEHWGQPELCGYCKEGTTPCLQQSLEQVEQVARYV